MSEGGQCLRDTHSVEESSAYCYRCGHYWNLRGEAMPKRCPRCRSSRWDVPEERQIRCSCGMTWTLTDSKQCCPSCGKGVRGVQVLTKLHCNRCEYDWFPRSATMPTRCPLCRSKQWNDPTRRLTCHACGHVWVAGSNDPARCPKCRSSRWNVPQNKVQCKVCGYKWVLRSNRTSDDVKKCPKCHSLKWNVTPKITHCNECGLSFVSRFVGSQSCPRCNKRTNFSDHRCSFCGKEWTSPDSISTPCPRCTCVADQVS